MWRLIAACAAAVALAAVVAHLALPKKYEASALVMPPKDASGSSLAARLGQFANALPFVLPGASVPAERYVDVLKSDRVSDAVIDRFGLMERYGTTYRSAARKKLAKSAEFEVTKGNLICVTVTDADPQRAADIANRFVDMLGEVECNLGVESAGRQRKFLDERIQDAQANLCTAQRAWEGFQEQHRIVRVDEGLRASATVLGELAAQRISREISLQVALTSLSEASPLVQSLREEVRRLTEKIDEITKEGLRAGALAPSAGPGEGGSSGAHGGDERVSQWLFPPVSEVPALALRQMELERELALQLKLYELLVTQRELAGIEEARSRTSMIVVSPATPPDRPAGLGLAGSFALAFVAGTLSVSGVLLLLAQKLIRQ